MFNRQTLSCTEDDSGCGDCLEGYRKKPHDNICEKLPVNCEQKFKRKTVNRNAKNAKGCGECLPNHVKNPSEDSCVPVAECVDCENEHNRVKILVCARNYTECGNCTKGSILDETKSFCITKQAENLTNEQYSNMKEVAVVMGSLCSIAIIVALTVCFIKYKSKIKDAILCKFDRKPVEHDEHDEHGERTRSNAAMYVQCS